MFVLRLYITLYVLRIVSCCKYSNCLCTYEYFQWVEGYGPPSSRPGWSGFYFVYNIFEPEAWGEDSILTATAKNDG